MNNLLFQIISSVWLFIFRVKRNFSKLFTNPKLESNKPERMLVSEACKNVNSVLDDVLAKQSEPNKHICCDLREDESVIYELYKLALSHLEMRLGTPTYNGIGGGNTYCKVARPAKIDPHDYSHSIQMAWWVVNDDFFYVLLSGHDADTSLCFTAHYVYNA